jgi:hypothetical protein
MEFSNYIRVPFNVEAVQIDLTNIEDIAALIGEVKFGDDNVPYILVNRRIVPIVKIARIGWYVTNLNCNYRVYSPEVFEDQFVERLGEFDYELTAINPEQGVLDYDAVSGNPPAEYYAEVYDDIPEQYGVESGEICPDDPNDPNATVNSYED